MCGPALAAVPAALSAVSTVVGFIGQQQQAGAAKTAANLNYASTTDALGRQNDELSAMSSEDHVTAAIREAQSFGRISALGSSLGLGTSSLTPAMGSAQAGIARNLAIEDMNVNSRRNNIQASATGALRTRDSDIAAHPSPGYLGLALGLGKDALGGYNSYIEAGNKIGVGSGAGKGTTSGDDSSGFGA